MNMHRDFFLGCRIGNPVRRALNALRLVCAIIVCCIALLIYFIWG